MKNRKTKFIIVAASTPARLREAFAAKRELCKHDGVGGKPHRKSRMAP